MDSIAHMVVDSMFYIKLMKGNDIVTRLSVDISHCIDELTHTLTV